MEIGSKVRVRPGFLYSGRIGVISSIEIFRQSAIANVVFDKPSKFFGRLVRTRAPYFLYKLQKIYGPEKIKLKKCMRWK